MAVENLKQWASLPEWPGYIFTSDGEVIRLPVQRHTGTWRKARRVAPHAKSKHNKTQKIDMFAEGGFRSICNVHLLMAQAFFPEYDRSLHRVGYRSGDKSDVSLSNLYLFNRTNPLC